jgi:pyruvate,water dikinase
MDLVYPAARAGAPAAVWNRRLADEFWSGAVTPLTFSLLAPPMVERMVEGPLGTAGLPSLLGTPVFRLHASHVYVNAGLLADVIDRLPGALRSDGLLALLPPEARARIREAAPLEGLPGALAIAGRLLIGERAWTPWQRAAAFEGACERIRSESRHGRRDEVDPSPWALVAEMSRVQDALGDYLAIVSWGIVFAYVFYHLLAELVRRWAPARVAECGSLTVGLSGVASLEAHHDVLSLGTLLVRRPDGREARTPDAVRALTERVLAADDAAGLRVRELLARHGHRLSGRDLLHPTWREAPELVVGLALRSAIALSSEDAAGRRIRARQAIEADMGGGAAGLARVGAFRAALAIAQRYYVVRENMRYHADFFLARLRTLALTLGQRLADDGLLAAPTDVFFLTSDELRHAVAPLESRNDDEDRAPDRHLATLAFERRLTFEDEAAASPPATLEASDHPRPHVIIDPTAPVTTLTGEIGAAGRARGRARLITGPADFDRVESGDVLVAAYADPAWTPILDLAAGLVLEAGGQLSHGAIVARELGIPALVSVAGALRSIRDGDVIALDTTADRGELALTAAGEVRTWSSP